MRTTLTLDADVARSLRAAVQRRGISFKEAVNNALRAGLGLETAARRTRTRFVTTPHAGGLKAGIDPRKLGKLADELEAQTTLQRIAGR